MRPFTSTISLDEAQRRLAATVEPIARTERLALADAAGHVAAEDVASRIDVPSFARAAVDGYALVAASTFSANRGAPVRLQVVERIYTGQLPRATIVPGTCAEIATGAPIPPGADAIVMVEDTQTTGSEVAIVTATVSGQHVHPRGADITSGAIVVRRGDVLTPGRVGALAAIGCTDVEAYARPRVAMLSTGSEVVAPGRPLGPGQVFDVNRFTLAAVVSAHGGIPDMHPPVPDSIDALMAALDRCLAADIVIFSGGSSVGERDLILDVIAARGEMIFHGIAVRPGKPTAFAKILGKPFFGMPGNPTSCLSNAYVLLVPFLRATARLPPLVPRTTHARLARRIVSALGIHQFFPVRMADTVAWPAFKGSGAITSLSQADGYIQIPPEQGAVDEDTIVEVTLF